MSVVAFCAACGAPRQSAARFCGRCGAAFPAPELCPTCGQSVPPGTRLATTTMVAATNAGPSTVSGSGTGDPRLHYGERFDSSQDCNNCGAPGAASGVCPICESHGT